MALTLTEQIQLIDETLKPTASTESFIDLINVAVVGQSISFNTTHKVVPRTSDNAEAVNYIDKMLVATSRAISEDNLILMSLRDIMASIMSSIAADAATVVALPLTTWEAFISNAMLTCMEIFAGIRVEEKTAYNDFIEV